MTEQRTLKHAVRARMARTGERYSAARAGLLTPDPEPAPPEFEPTVSDDVIRRRTGRGWDEWLALLDGWGAARRKHAEIARWLVDEQGAAGWDAQTITVSFERARGLRAVGERAGGFSAGASRTVAVPVQRLYDAWLDPALREQWLPGAELGIRTATAPRSARFDWEDGRTRVIVGFQAKGDAKSAAFVEHERLAGADEAERLKAFWRERLTALKTLLEA